MVTRNIFPFIIFNGSKSEIMEKNKTWTEKNIAMKKN